MFFFINFQGRDWTSESDSKSVIVKERVTYTIIKLIVHIFTQMFSPPFFKVFFFSIANTATFFFGCRKTNRCWWWSSLSSSSLQQPTLLINQAGSGHDHPLPLPSPPPIHPSPQNHPAGRARRFAPKFEPARRRRQRPTRRFFFRTGPAAACGGDIKPVPAHSKPKMLSPSSSSSSSPPHLTPINHPSPPASSALLERKLHLFSGVRDFFPLGTNFFAGEADVKRGSLDLVPFPPTPL